MQLKSLLHRLYHSSSSESIPKPATGFLTGAFLSPVDMAKAPMALGAATPVGAGLAGPLLAAPMLKAMAGFFTSGSGGPAPPASQPGKHQLCSSVMA